MEQALWWTGRLEFDLNNGSGLAVATIDMSVRRDTVLLYIGNRTIAGIDRDRFRGWLQHPYEPLIVDDVEWSYLGGDLAFKVDESVPYIVHDELARDLVVKI